MSGIKFKGLSHKMQDFRNKKNYWTQTVCFDFLYNIFCNIPHSKKNPAKILTTNIYRYLCKVPVNLSYFKKTGIF